MEIIVSSVIGGQIVAEVGMERVLHQLIIEMRKSLKKQFANNSFDGLDKTKINIYKWRCVRVLHQIRNYKMSISSEEERDYFRVLY